MTTIDPIIAGWPKATNDNVRRINAARINSRIDFYELEIERLMLLAGECTCSIERGELAKQIGYCHIEIDHHLKPLLERV